MRFARRKTKPYRSASPDQINIGFLPTIDSAVLIAAKELGLFERRGLTVRLTREVGWATVREKLLHEELDAAAAHASMLFTIYAGVGGVRRRCLTGLMLGLNGSAITLSNGLRELGVRDARSFGEVVRSHQGRKTFTLGMVLTHSTQNYYLRQWLTEAGLNPDKDVQTVVIPSNLVYETFKEGHLDGFCVADPWNSLAVLEQTGWVVSTTAEMGHHPEKVLLVLNDFAEEREDEHLQLIAALIEASIFCDQPECRPELVRMLAQPRYFDVSPECLANALIGPFHCGREHRAHPDFVRFDARTHGNPDRNSGKWVLDMVRSLSDSEPLAGLKPDGITRVFREDIFQRALRRYNANVSGNIPDPDQPRVTQAREVSRSFRPSTWGSMDFNRLAAVCGFAELNTFSGASASH